VCQAELRITKTNTELTTHATNKHGKPLDECFPGAAKIAEEMAQGSGKKGEEKQGETKAERKKKQTADFNELLSAGLTAGKKGKK